MLKQVAIGGAVLVLAGLGYHQYEIGQIEGSLDDLAAELRPLGELDYSRVRIGVNGHLHVEGLRFDPHALPGRLQAERISLESESIPELLRLRRTLARDRLPRALGVSVHQLRIPATWSRANANAPLARFFTRLDTAGCAALADSDHTRVLDRLGLDRPPVDLALSYRIEGSGERMELRSEHHAGGLGIFHTRMELEPRAGTRNLDRLAPALLEAPMRELTFEYRDAGYYASLQDLCIRESGMAAEPWREHHMGEWLQVWADAGLQPGPILTHGYREFIANPESVEIRVGRVREPLRETRGMDSPVQLLDQLDLRLTVNGERIGPVDLHTGNFVGLPEEDQPAPEQDPTAAETATLPAPDSGTETALAPGAPTGGILAWEALPGHVDRYAIVITERGHRRPGRLLEAGDDHLRLRQRLHGGFIVIRLQRDEIREVRAAR
ncbi:hypothetical protein [Thioalkalivibrio halophilus]|uniref:Uncharacterized protein n=1 Tax=Thioalkalivibrio halophilus TaxID=252474 RepID=A0A1V3A003_9GAMM|nr:hypothetical protein [Thioalkalivibrio halophilus]OOC10674.1 hypothetical protein B1A74_04375 [Thioalkalivibrio halophilus]